MIVWEIRPRYKPIVAELIDDSKVCSTEGLEPVLPVTKVLNIVAIEQDQPPAMGQSCRMRAGSPKQAGRGPPEPPDCDAPRYEGRGVSSRLLRGSAMIVAV